MTLGQAVEAYASGIKLEVNDDKEITTSVESIEKEPISREAE